jgi:hypothetical protein
MKWLYCIIEKKDIKNYNLFYNINRHFNKKKDKFILKINEKNLSFLNKYTKFTYNQIINILKNDW